MFTKGQPVTFLHTWDDKGTVRIVDLVVHSCGKKQMILVDEQGVKFQGANFRPCGEHGYSRVVPRLSPEAAEAAALELGATIVAAERARFEDRIVRWPDSAAFVDAMHAGIAALHEPRFIRREVA